MSPSRRKGQSEAEILRNAYNAKDAVAKYTAELAIQCDSAAALDILREIAEVILLSGESAWTGPIPWPYALYIAEAFLKICKGMDASLALGTKQKKAGRPRGVTIHNKVQLAAAYWLLVRHDRKPEQAIKIVHAMTGADRRTIQRAARECLRLKRHPQIDDALLEYFAGPRIGAAVVKILSR